MGIIGYDITPWGGAKGSQNVDSTSWTGWQDVYTYTPLVNERVVSFNINGKADAPAGTINLILYDVTNPLSAIPVGDIVNFSGLTTSFTDYSLPPVSEIILTAGTPYAVAFLSSDSSTDSDIAYAASEGGTLRQDGSPSQTPPNPYTYTTSNARSVGMFVITEPVATGPTITGPDSTTEGAVTVQTGTLQDTIVTQSLISGSYSIEQTINSATAGTLNYVAESGVNQCTPSTPVSGVPLQPTITAAGITPYVVQQKADDGVNPPATRNITLNPEATVDVIQTMIAVANTTPDQSIFGSTWVTVEDNHQARLPKLVDGVTFTWNDKGEFTTDIDKTVTFQYELFSPASGNWSAISLTVKDTSIIAVGMVSPIVSSIVSNIVSNT